MTVIDATKLTGVVLQKGAHTNPEEGMCLVEALNYALGRPHTDQTPPCTSPVLGDMGRSLNDVLPDDLRQDLFPLLFELPGTADGQDEQRSYMALDWLIRTWLPAWLELSPACREDAAKIRGLGRIVDLVSAERAGPVVRQAQKTAAAAWAAARDAARAAAGNADRAWAGAAARAAAGDAAWAAAWDAAGAAAGGAAWGAARGAARDAAGAAAGDAARGAARDAARAAAGAVLAPTVEQLQRSVIELYRRMTLVGKNADGGAS